MGDKEKIILQLLLDADAPDAAYRTVFKDGIHIELPARWVVAFFDLHLASFDLHLARMEKVNSIFENSKNKLIKDLQTEIETLRAAEKRANICVNTYGIKGSMAIREGDECR